MSQWVNSLRPSDAMWRHTSESTLAQVMACYLTAPSHYLNQCGLIINDVQCHSYSGQEMPQPSITKICLKITCLKFHSNFPGANELKQKRHNSIANTVELHLFCIIEAFDIPCLQSLILTFLPSQEARRPDAAEHGSHGGVTALPQSHEGGSLFLQYATQTRTLHCTHRLHAAGR